MSFLIGLWLGGALGALGMWWALLSPSGEKAVIDLWWLDNEGRWLGLREELLKERESN